MKDHVVSNSGYSQQKLKYTKKKECRINATINKPECVVDGDDLSELAVFVSLLVCGDILVISLTAGILSKVLSISFKDELFRFCWLAAIVLCVDSVRFVAVENLGVVCLVLLD